MTTQVSPSPWLTCPVCTNTKRILSLSKDMVHALRKLRRDLKACDTCQIDPEDCPIRRDLNSQIQTAIQVVVDEFHLS